ncbi:MAG: arylesterase [Rhodospirillaceae bacterium]
MAEIKILALGDSLTAGYGLAPGESFADQLQAALRAKGHRVTVVNAGVSGDTTAGGLARVDWLLGDRPDAAIVELGANDGLRGIDPASTKANLNGILEKMAANDVPVLLAGMLAPPNLGSEFGEAFNSLFPVLAEQHDAVYYPFFLEGVARVPELNLSDGIHPTAEGIGVIVENILPKAEELLARVPQG